jgi:hypothetical protein
MGGGRGLRSLRRGPYFRADQLLLGLRWHLWVWDMSFLIWGLLFASAAWYFTRRDRGNGILGVPL